MSTKFEAKIGIKIFLGVVLLLFDKILLEFQISWKSGQIWPNFTNKKPFLFSKKILKIFFVKFLAQSSILDYAISRKNLWCQKPKYVYSMHNSENYIISRVWNWNFFIIMYMEIIIRFQFQSVWTTGWSPLWSKS